MRPLASFLALEQWPQEKIPKSLGFQAAIQVNIVGAQWSWVFEINSVISIEVLCV